VARLAQRLLGWSDADVADVVQEVFIAAWTNLGSFRGDASISTWLTRLTINECRRHRRRRLARLSMLTRFLQKRPPPQAHVDSDPLARDERLSHVRSAVQRLPAKYREVIVLRYLEELEVSEIMQALGLSANAINVRLHRARELLSQKLNIHE
jgi:RNA polymerase sigma-70 factor (ECF subfamily)